MEQDVGQVGAARSAQMRMGKPVDRPIIVMITRTGVPVVRPRIGTELHHAEWSRGAGIGVPVESGPDEGIDIFERSGRTGTGGTRKRCKCQNQGSHHDRSDGLEFRVYKYNKAAAVTGGDFRFCVLISRRHFAGETPSREELRTKKRTGQRRFCEKRLSLAHKRSPEWHVLSF